MKTSELVQEAIEALSVAQTADCFHATGKQNCPGCRASEASAKLQAALPRIKAEEAVVKAASRYKKAVEKKRRLETTDEMSPGYSAFVLAKSAKRNAGEKMFEAVQALQSLEVE